MATRADAGVRRLAKVWHSTCAALLPPDQNPPPERTASHEPGEQVASADPRWSRHHLAHTMVLLTDTLQTVACPTTSRPMSLSEALEHRDRATDALAAISERVITTETAADLARQARGLLLALEDRLATAGLPTQVEAVSGPIRLTDHLRCALLEATTMLLRDRCATPGAGGARVPDQALVESSRTVAAVLSQRHGGRTVEVRVPPACAVQLEAFGAGPSHHRGTPPNVVETDTSTFVCLATGLSTWQRARERGLLRASGAHAGAVGEMLPVVDLAASLAVLVPLTGEPTS